MAGPSNAVAHEHLAILARTLHDKASAIGLTPEQVALLTATLHAPSLRPTAGSAAPPAAPSDGEQRYRALFERNPDGIFAVNVQGRFIDANPACETMTGYSRAELLKMSFLQLCAPDQLARTVDRFQGAITGAHSNLETALIRKDGTRVELLVTGGPVILSGELVEIHCAARDITDRKRAEAALRASEERLNRAQEIAHLGSWELDLCSDCLSWSDEVYRIFGLQPQEFAATYEAFLEAVHPNDRAAVDAAYTGSVIEGRDSYEIEHRIVRKPSGEVRIVHEKCQHVRDATGQIIRSVGMVHDITDRKRQEEDLARSKAAAEAASAAKDQFLAVLSHELRTPLTPVLTIAQLMERDRSLSPEHRESLTLIRRNVELEARLIDDLLDLTRIARGKLELNFAAVDVHEKLRHVIHMIEHDAAARQLVLSFEAAASDHHVQADGARLQQVFWNILKNAIKFTRPGGMITVRTSNARENHISVTVQDTGIGIEPDLLPRLFDAFEQGGRDVTRQFGGLGLGLAISKGLVDLHGGTLTAHSEGRGRGATFVLEFRTSRASESADSAPADDRSAVKTKAYRILLVEDHPDTLRVMSRLLHSYGHDVLAASSVASALAVAAASEFDLLISDIGLPDGSGLDLMQQLRLIKPVKGIALSGFGTEGDVRKSLEAGFIAHVTKPVNLQKLEDVIAEALG